MRLIQVLGTGCPRSNTLAQSAQQAAAELGIPARVEQVTDMDVITEFAVMATPALVVDGQVKLVGRVPSTEELKALIGG
jgi:small redox-active disulfide protein 2